MRSALVIGGSGPTGPFVVDGLLARGWRVTMLHSGTHKPQRAWYMDGTVEVLLANAFDEADLARVLSGRCFELGVVMYGQLRTISRLFKDASTIGGRGCAGIRSSLSLSLRPGPLSLWQPPHDQ